MRKGIDFHCHVREGNMLRKVLSYTAAQFQGALIMPNTDPPKIFGSDAAAYKTEIETCRDEMGIKNFNPLMTIKLVEGKTTPEVIRSAFHDYHVIAGKLYPHGVTTNSKDGVRDFYKLSSVFEAMEEVGMVLCLHGEASSPVFCLDREKVFLDKLFWMVSHFPRLRIVLEHITTEEACNVIRHAPENVAATITVHHLVLTLDDVIGSELRPHHFCKPVAKRPEDREALWNLIKSMCTRVFLGTDTAPHARIKKECAEGCAGVFSAPVAIPLLAQLFEEWGILPLLEDFVSIHGPMFYGLAPCDEILELVRIPWKVPDHYSGIVPFWAGREISWQVKNVS